MNTPERSQDRKAAAIPVVFQKGFVLRSGWVGTIWEGGFITCGDLR